jgi:hypothetical protein
VRQTVANQRTADTAVPRRRPHHDAAEAVPTVVMAIHRNRGERDLPDRRPVITADSDQVPAPRHTHEAVLGLPAERLVRECRA